MPPRSRRPARPASTSAARATSSSGGTEASGTRRSFARWPRLARRRGSASPATSGRCRRLASGTTSRDGSSPTLAAQREDSRRHLYRRAIADHALSVWRGWRLADVEPADVRDLFAQVRERGGSGAQLKTLRAALLALFSTAAEDGDLSSNPIRGSESPTETLRRGRKRRKQRDSPARS